MSTRSYSTLVGCVLVILFGGLWATDNLLLCTERLSQNYPYRAYPPLSEMSPFLASWGVSDALLGSFPALAYIHQSLQAGYLPLWNPLEGLGLPAAGSMGLGYMFPVHWLTYGLLSPLLAWHVELMAIIALGSISAFAVFRRLTDNGEAAALGATAWAFGGWSAAYLQLPSYSWTLALFPCTLLGVELAREQRSWAHLQVGVCVASILTVGHPQMVVPALGLSAAWTLWRAAGHRVGLFLAMAAGVVMAGYHLLPMAELLRLSEREPIPLDLVLNALLLPREFLGMVFPTLMGQPSDNFYFGALLASPVINGREHCVFSGVITLLLALLAAWRRPTSASRPLAGMALSGLILAGVPWLYGAICRVFPPLLFLTPTRFLPFALFAICLLSAQGWASLAQQPLQRRESRALMAVLGGFAAGALYFIIPATTLSAGFQSWLFEMAKVNYAAKPPYFEGDFGPVFVERVVAHFSFTSPAIAVSFLVVIASLGLLYRYTGKSLPFAPVFAVLCVDLAMFFAVMNTPSPAASYFPKNPDISHLSQRSTLANPAQAPYRVMGLGDGPYPNLLLVEGIANLEAYESAHPADFRRIIDALNSGFLMDHQSALYVGDDKLENGPLDLLGLGTIYNAPGKWDPRYPKPDHQGRGIWSLNRDTALRAFLIDRYRTGDRAEANKTMMTPGFDARTEAVLETAPSYSSPADTRFENVLPLEYTPQRVVFKVNSDHPTLLVLNDLQYPGWKATVNGRPQPILKAYGFARAVELAEGESQVVYQFAPTGFPYTPWLAALSFFLLFGFSLGQRRANR